MEIVFKFKGERHYVHGTDIYSAVEKFLNSEFDSTKIGLLDLAFHKQASKNLILESSEQLPKHLDQNICVSVKFNYEKKVHYLFLKESNNQVVNRYDFLDSDITSKGIYDKDGNCAQIKILANFSLIENIVILNKGLHENIFPENNKKWLFARLVLDNFNTELKAKTLKLRLKRNFQFKLTKTEILLDDIRLGDIYFAT